VRYSKSVGCANGKSELRRRGDTVSFRFSELTVSEATNPFRERKLPDEFWAYELTSGVLTERDAAAGPR
jgi:hypothetical protein